MTFSRAHRFVCTINWLLIFALLSASTLRAQSAQTIPTQSSNAQPKTSTVEADAAPQQARRYTSRASREALAYANAELRRMSLDEKIGQLISVGINATFLNQDSEAYRRLRRQVEENHIGGIILFRGPVYESVILVNRMQAHAKRPLLVSADLEAGSGMRFDDTINFPWNMAVGASGDPQLARRQGEMTAREARALGIHQIFAPVVDVNNNSENPVINVRSYGEDPEDVGRFAAAFIEGAQTGGVIATAKHFPGHGDTATDSHRGLPVINVNQERLNSLELVPFRHALKAGVGAVMAGHIGLPQIDATKITLLPTAAVIKPSYTEEGGEVMTANATTPATLSSTMLTGMLRRNLNFDGLIVTDAMDMSGLTLYFDQAEAAVRAIEAGADILLKPADADAMVRGLRASVQSRRLTEGRIEDSARRILAAKFDLGLVANRITPLDGVDRTVSTREAAQLAGEIATRALTLVRDTQKLLPLRTASTDERIFNLAITNGEDRLFIATPFVSALQRGGRKVETIVLDERSSDAEVQRALERAKGATLVIASLYGRVRSGQARSVGLPEPGARALNSLLKANASIVGISFGNPYLLQSFPDLQTYLVAYGDMPSLQHSAARAVLGETDITGKLPITLPSLAARGTGIQLKAVNTNAMTTTQ